MRGERIDVSKQKTYASGRRGEERKRDRRDVRGRWGEEREEREEVQVPMNKKALSEILTEARSP